MAGGPWPGRGAGLLALLWLLAERPTESVPSAPRLRAAAAFAASAQRGADVTGRESGRWLASIASELNLTDITLRLLISGSAIDAVEGESLTLHAGRPIQALQLVLNASDEFIASAPRLKLVNASVDSDAAVAGACAGTGYALGLNRVNRPFGNETGTSAELLQSNSVLNAALDTEGLLFKMGGSFRLCYSDTGTFAADHADVLNVSLEVAGAYDSCAAADCLQEQRYFCYARKGAHSTTGSCALSYDGAGSGLYGSSGKASWSELWAASWDSSGAQQGLTRGQCGTTPDNTVLCSLSDNETHPECTGADFYMEPETTQSKFELPMTQALTGATQGYTVAACYCPGLDSCDSDADFVQQIGVVLFFVSKLCDPSDSSCSGSPGFSGVVPKQGFTVMVHCPPDGCTANDDSRLKLVDYTVDGDRPSWDSAHGCRSAAQTALQEAPVNCYSVTNCVLTGGTRQDWKAFGGTGTHFSLSRTGGDYEVRNFHSSKLLDACFCVEGCASATNWFKVGHLVLSPYRLLDAGISRLTTVGVPGSLGFYRGVSDRDSLGLAPSSLLKLLAESDAEVGDDTCKTNGDVTQVTGMDEGTWRSNLQGALDGSDAGVLAFNSGTSTNLFPAERAGIVAICYCRSATCATVSDDWILAARITVRGPARNQAWSFHTGVAVRLSYAGYGLASSDTLRITPSNVDCNTDTNNPSSDTTVMVGCPLACTAYDNTPNRMTLATKVLDHNSVGCDTANANCQTVYVRRITVLSATTTEVEFAGNPGLGTGDRIVLGSGIQCGSDCSAEQLAAIGGPRSSGNGGTYSVGVTVTATRQGHLFTLSVGWSAPAPKFEVPNGQGQWTRPSMGTTAEEIKGTEDRSNLKVCWAHGGDGTYVAQVGTVSFIAPSQMSAQVSLTTLAMDATAPFVISFTTDQRSAYTSAVNSLQLKLSFTNVDYLEPHYTNKDRLAETPGVAEHSLVDAGQAACGRLFLELWSSDSAKGFPLPRGCYYKLLGRTREIFILFEPGNGLSPRKHYQIVMMGTAKNGLTTGLEAVSVLSMDDVVLRPHEVVEAGKGSVSVAPLEGPTEDEPRFRQSSGLSVLGGSGALRELEGELDLSVRLAGDAVGQIVKETILRLFLRPLTQWDMSYTVQGSECSVECTPHDQMRCGAVGQCVVQQVVSNSLKNVVKVRLPSDMTPITDVVQHVFRIRSLSLPSGGFFATRIGAQLTTKEELAPTYAESIGDYLWKRPAEGATVGELVVREGDGNSRPFQGDERNVLYAHLRLGATLRRTQARAGAASLTVTLPEGYTGVRAGAAPAGLGALGGEDAPGRGTPDVRRWACVGRACSYTLEANDFIPAGTDIVTSFLVNNPVSALRRDDVRNQWHTTLRSTGDHTTTQLVPETAFQATPGDSDFGDNVAVLGKLADYCLQPSDFTASVSHDLLVFLRPAQPVAAGGYVLVDAPALFDFGDPCAQQDLEPAYHAAGQGAVGSSRTWRLPAAQGCAGAARAGSSTRNRAKIQLGGLLHAQRRYGFRLRVANPQTFAPAQLTGWSLSTASSALEIVDGTPTAASFNPLQGGGVSGGLLQSWGLYAGALNTTTQVAIHLSSSKPYSLTGEEATVTVFPFRPGIDVETSLRIIAPHGYEWYFSGQDFVYHSDSGGGGGSQTRKVVGGATADLPGKVPSRLGNVLTWPAARYSASHTYGFIAKIRVPDFTPRGSSNAFFVEFGYSDQVLLAGVSRALAARIEAPAIQALGNVHVDYTASVVGQVNTLLFQVETITHIPQGGGLFIQGPVGFSFPEACQPEAVPGSSRLPLPDDLTCSFQAATSAGASELLLAAGGSGLAPGLYAFRVTGTNPSTARANRDGQNTACGWKQCWHFHSLADAANPLASPELDARASAPGFAIKDAMAHAHLVPLGQAARTSTGRNDMPMQQNRLTFSFTLKRDVFERSQLLLRGPSGFQFEEDCLTNEGVVTEPGVLSATAASLLEPHGAWEEGVPVLACEGGGAVARLEVGAGLQRYKPYLFCIKVKANPSYTPAQNKWTIESDSEASEQFDGFTLMTFTEASVSALRSAARPSGTQPLYYVNVTFRPHTDVPAPGGVLVVTAPTGFGLVKSTTLCPLLLEERDPLRGAGAPASAFSSSEVSCAADTSVEVLELRLAGARALVAGRDYTLTAQVINPSTVTPAAQWMLQSFTDQARGTALDLAYLSGFAVNPALAAWSYVDVGASMKNGGMSVDDLQLRMIFPDDLSYMDQISVLAPAGYDLSDPAQSEGERRCKDQRWGGSASFTAGTTVACEGRRLVVQVGEAQGVAAGTDLRLFFSTRNPSMSPSWAENFWHVRHLNAQGGLLSSDVFAGWDVVPQLEQVQVSMSGEAMPAGSSSTLDVVFTAISEAASVKIQARAPLGFDFSQSYLPLQGQEATSTVGNLIRCTVAISPGVQTLVRVRGVRLADMGGPTEFDLTTYTASGSVADRTLGFHAFRLPGSIAVASSELWSEHRQSPGLYPVKALWEPQLGAAALARLVFSLSDDALVGQNLELHAPPFSLQRQRFRIVDVETDVAAATTVTYATGSLLRAELQSRLQSMRQYRLEASATAPQQMAESSSWSLQITDGGALPASLSGQISTGFRLVSTFGLVVSAHRTPPLAEVEVTLQISFGSASPTALTVVAPPGFSFGENCLVGSGAGISTCSPGPSVAGRPSAELGVSAEGLGTVLQNLRLKVNTPRASPSAWSWFIEGTDTATGQQVGWGEDSNGLEVQQMRDVSLTYGGVPGLTTQLVVGFRAGEVVERGGQIQVFKPPEYEAECNTSSLRPISLAGSISLEGADGCQVQSSSVLLTLTSTLQRGEYAFAFDIRTPRATPGLNLFSVALVDRHQAVQDAAMDLPGQALRAGYPLRATALSWTSAEAGQASSVTMGFVVEEEMAIGSLGKVLLSFPQNFAHAIERECGVEQTNSALPLLEQDVDSGQCSFIDIRNLDRLLIHLDPNRAIPAGTYEFRFPVTVPEQLPPYNVWLVTFCGPAATSCLQARGPEALLTFPLAGFDYGQRPPGWQPAQSGAGHTVANPLLGLATLLLAMVVAVL